MLARRLGLLLLLLGLSPALQALNQVSSDTLRLSFSDSGQLESAIACFPSCSDENTRLQQVADETTVGWDEFTGGAWSRAIERSEKEYRLRFEHSSGASAEWTIPARGYRIELELDVPGDLALRSGEPFRPREAAGFGAWLEQARYVILGDGEVTQVAYDDESEVSATDSQWIGFRNRFWAVLAAPPATSEASLLTAEGRQDADLRITAEPGTWSFYIGPVEPNALAQAAEGLDKVLYAGLWFWLRWICLGLFQLLAWIQLWIPSWGLAIVALSLVVSILMWPLNRIAERLQIEVSDIEERLAPELQRIKSRHKGAEQSEKILALYKAENVHPLYSLKGMLGLILVIPVFIGAFGMLAENIHLLNTPFLWMRDLSRPDGLFELPFPLPFFGAEFNLLPFVMAGLSVIASKLHQPPSANAGLRRRQRLNMILMSVLFFGLFYTFPAGMVLYWTTNNLVSVIRNLRNY